MYLWQPRNMNKRHVDILQLAGRGVQLQSFGQNDEMALTSLSSAPPGTEVEESLSRGRSLPPKKPPLTSIWTPVRLWYPLLTDKYQFGNIWGRCKVRKARSPKISSKTLQIQRSESIAAPSSCSLHIHLLVTVEQSRMDQASQTLGKLEGSFVGTTTGS